VVDVKLHLLDAVCRSAVADRVELCLPGSGIVERLARVIDGAVLPLVNRNQPAAQYT
jgi:hypothetical protein